MHQQPQPERPSFKEQVNAFIGFAQIFSLPLELLLHRPGSMGENHVNGRTALGAIFAILTVWLVGGPVEAHLIPWTFGAAVVLLLLHRKRDPNVHSRYTGYPWWPIGKEVWIKRSIEPALGFCAAILCVPFSMGLAAWFFLASVGLIISVEVSCKELEARRRAMKDAWFDQQQMFGGDF